MKKVVGSYSVDPEVLQEFTMAAKQLGLKASPVVEQLMIYFIEKKAEIERAENKGDKK